MNQTVPAWMQKLAALAILALLLCAAYLFLVNPALERRATLKSERQGLIERTEKFRTVAASGAELRRQLLELKNEEKLRQRFFSTATQALAGAELQKYSNEVIRQHAAKLKSTQTLRASSEDEDGRFSVRMQFSATNEALQAIFHTLENSEKSLTIDRVDISRVRRRGNRARTALLDVRMVLSGYYWPAD